MAVYSKLLLSAGGGIVSVQQQAEQERNTATVLIGLGGTGVDCLRTIKTQVRARLKPDDPDAIIPAYSHIRFLGVDTDRKSAGIVGSEEEERADSLLALDDTEFFSIANSHVKRDLSNKLALRDREELNWLCHERIQAGDLTIAGAGGIRQVGRYMLMDKSNLFLSRIEQEINAAKRGLVNPTVNIHIFSGLSGGTGAGTFLDVCYMVRSVVERIGDATLFGYFFLPDVNLSRIPHENTKVREYIPRNGYASMQELDYCMGLQENGGAFVQTYQGHHQIEWSKAPVDLCHLVCATNANGDEVDNAYDYAMNVTTEYVMDFLTQSEGFDLTSHLSNFRSMVGEADGNKMYGMNMSYCVIGASCANLPLREINTYVASELFERFAQVRDLVPTGAKVQEFAVSALAGSSLMGAGQLYDALKSELLEDVDASFAPFPDDYKMLLEYGDKELVSHYQSQTASKVARVETKARGMQDANNEHSLIGRLRKALAELICDINYGPLYAHRMLSAAETHNILNIIDGLIAENKENQDQEIYQGSARQRDVDNAKRDFTQRRKRGLFDNDQKRYDEYVYFLMMAEQHNFDVKCYAYMDAILHTLREQIVEVDTNFYRRLSRVTSSLVDTFRENHDALANERAVAKTSSFAMPLMTIAELKGPMDRELEKIDVAGMLSSFMGLMLDNSEEWLQEDENKICRLVTKFFVEIAFGEFAGRSITSFLKDKYNTDNDEDLTNRIYSEWMRVLTEKARPLFYFNGTIWSEDQTSRIAFLSVPSTSAPIQSAAKKMQDSQALWDIKKSALTDRIYVMCSSAALPLSSYNNCDLYEREYYKVTNRDGTHYYEGKPIPGMLFDDWRKLPPLTPQSLVNVDRVPDQVRRIVEEGRALFDEATNEHLFDEERNILCASAASLEALRSAAKACEDMAVRMDSPSQTDEARDLLGKLDAAANLTMEPTILEHSGQEAGLKPEGYAGKEEAQVRIFEDRFLASPTFMIITKRNLDDIREVRKSAAEAKRHLQERIEAVSAGTRDMTNYCEALFTGVITLEGRVVTFHRNDNVFGDEAEITLSKRGSEFMFGQIPVFQGYESYKQLSPELKSMIRTMTDERINAEDPEVLNTLTKLKAVFTPERFNAWTQQASNFPVRNEIVEFLKGLKESFDAFCSDFM